MKKKALIILGLWLISTVIYAQTTEKQKYQRLKIGDKVPEDLCFDHMVNYTGGKAKMSDFKGKVVILDFWNMACSPCIGAFPKMEKLQAKFGDKLQILLVNVINPWTEMVKAGFPDKTKSPIISRVKLPFVLNTPKSTISDLLQGRIPLAELFPHAAEPYHAWIDANGIFRGDTRGAEVTENSISYFLKNNTVITNRSVLTLEDIGITKENKHQSILNPNNEYVKRNIMYSSVLFKGLNIGRGLEASLTDSITGKLVGIRSKPLNLLDLYVKNAVLNAMPESSRAEFEQKLFSYYIHLDLKNPKLFCPPKDESEYRNWRENNFYFYELLFPFSKVEGMSNEETSIHLYQQMRQEIERYFGIHSFIDKRKVKCWVLVRTSSKDKLATQSKEAIYSKTYDNGLIVKNGNLAMFTESFTHKNCIQETQIFPFVNETGFDIYSKKIDLNLSNLSEIEKIRQDLNNYDLDLIEAERELRVLVISDKK